MSNEQEHKISSDNQKQNKIILSYYPIRGVAQAIRILSYYLDINFKDNFIAKNQENQIESGFRIGFPMLQDGSIKIHQQISIMNYLCIKSGKQQLLGLTPQHNAKINELLFKYSTQKKKIMSTIMEGLKFIQDPNVNTNKKLLCQKTLKKVVQECKFIEICMKKYLKIQSSQNLNQNGNKKYIFDYITVIDFLFYQICYYITGFYKEYIQKESQYYCFVKYKQQFEKQGFYSKNKTKIQSIPLFFQFSSPALNLIVTKSWKGDNYENLFVKNNSNQQINVIQTKRKV